ncbi:hypothetical protein BZG36_02831 [Bifiguratus adelaidae]|uniref:UBX domain-containing protein 1 n=1 Tax=Bifiguratus adelaidae TaxID=1938954 RepID=A0A261Y0L6_9FUNG|nr:hypothetical protein BZG36_02831 [Bifiguratus adelaidae]
MSTQDELVAQFKALVQCPSEQARFYLEANNWNLETAVAQYYDVEAGGHSAPAHEEGDDDDDDYVDEDEGQIQQPVGLPGNRGQTSTPPRAGSAPRQTRSNIATLSDMLRRSNQDQEGQNLFAGGERSGINVQNPDKRNANELVENILKKAAEGHKLGGSEEPSVSDSRPSTSSFNIPSEPREGTAVRNITFWRNGFSIGDGPLFRYDDPANQDFLRNINTGQAPVSLLNVRPGQKVDVRVARRLDEDYVPPPKAPPKPFEGASRRLGSPVPPIITSDSASPVNAPGAYPTTQASSASASTKPSSLEVDDTQPVTTLQIRMADGTRMVAKFNHTHTIGDIRNFVRSSRPNESSQSFILQTPFPVRRLEDDDKTLSDAKLLNAVIVQKYE